MCDNFHEIVNQLIRRYGSRKVSINSVAEIEEREYDSVITCKLNQPIKYISTKDYCLSESQYISFSNYTLGEILNVVEYMDYKKDFWENLIPALPNEIISKILSSAILEVIQVKVMSGEEYRNPFYPNSQPEIFKFDRDLYVNHIVGILLDKSSEVEFAKSMQDMLGI